MEEIEYKIWFSKLDINNKVKLNLLKEFKNCKNIWNLNSKELKELGYKKTIILKLQDDFIKKDLDIDKKFIEKNNIKLLNNYDKNFPKKLLEINDCPSQIYVWGDESKLNEDNISIIGSRKASLYGKNIARKIARDFSDLDINVVSGLAIGIDKYAHLGALDVNKGKTIAVIGSGFSARVFYPYENLKLYERIIKENGVVVSEYPIFSKPFPYHFPARNRIISGLSNKIIVVEAGIKSGSLITVEFALEQGKDVYAVPGNINQYNSLGTNKLIQDGAYPFLSVQDCFI